MAFIQKMIRATLGIGRLEVFDSNCAVNSLSDISRCHGVLCRVLGVSVGGAISHSATDSTPCHQDALAVGPVIASRAVGTPRSRIPYFGLTSHLTGDQNQRFIEQATLVKIDQ